MILSNTKNNFNLIMEMKMNLTKLKRMMLFSLPDMKIVGFQQFVCSVTTYQITSHDIS